MSVSKTLICCFAFRNCSAQVQSALDSAISKFVVEPDNIEDYLAELIRTQPDYILGLGDYTGKDQEQLRIETIAKNQFRNQAIMLNSPLRQECKLNSFLPLVEEVKIAKALGNSWCNLISWHIGNLIQEGKLKSQYTFLHIPKKFSASRAAKIIEEMLLKLKTVEQF